MVKRVKSAKKSAKKTKTPKRSVSKAQKKKTVAPAEKNEVVAPEVKVPKNTISSIVDTILGDYWAKYKY